MVTYRIMGDAKAVASLKSRSGMGDDPQKLNPWSSLRDSQAARQKSPSPPVATVAITFGGGGGGQ